MFQKVLVFCPRLIVALTILVSLPGCSSLTVEKFYENGVVATSSPIATDIGLNILKDGGNAIDAAVAIGFVLAVCRPEAGNIGGGGFALVFFGENNEVAALDFREKAPDKARADMYLDENGNVVANSSLIGARAAGVPGTVAGLFELWKRFGTWEWRRLLEPAIKLADTGFIIDEYLAKSLDKHNASLNIFPETKAVFAGNGNPFKSGDRFVQKDLASTLLRIANDSTDGFYSGQTADLIVQTMQRHGGLIDYSDLAAYRPAWRTPVRFYFDSLEVFCMPLPSSGGVVLGQILKLLEPYNFYKYNPDSPEYIHLFAEACRLAYADRASYLGDPDFIPNPTKALMDPSYIASRRKLINTEHAGSSQTLTGGIPGDNGGSESTTHFSIVDKMGNAVSLTYTINTRFGSRLVVGGAGFLLNNEMDDFSVKPSAPNYYGLVGGKANEIAPGKRMLSSMSPTIVMKEGSPFLVLGSPGGSKIITAVAQAIINFTRFGLNLKQTVKQPRFHHQWLPDTLYLEMGGFDINIIQDLISRGHNIKERNPYSDLQIIHIKNKKLMSGASDPRGNGIAKGY
jgi:gamma-glutamyltranspeptidase/glutathione hydrolase